MGQQFLIIEILVIGVLVIGLIALLWTKRNKKFAAPISEPESNLAPVILPATEDITSDDLHQLKFDTSVRGYRTDQVDEVLDQLALVIEQRDETIRQLRMRS